MRSPKWPNTKPPIGRAMNPTAYGAKEAMVPAKGSRAGKNSSLNTSAAAVPYKKKSYHSIVVPMKLAKTTRVTEPVVGAAPGVSRGILRDVLRASALRIRFADHAPHQG